MKELIERIKTLTVDFHSEAVKCADGNKSAGQRARKLSLAIEKELKEFRKESIEAGK